MYLFRALNSFDHIIDPINNGIASKKFIYNATESFLYTTQKEYINKLSKKEKDLYIKENMEKYLLDHKQKLFKKFERRHIPIRNNIYNFVKNKDNYSYFKMIKDLSSLPNHLINGSRTYTNWISSTNNFDKIWNYYDQQETHKVAIINAYTNGVFDENTYIVNVSDKETIQNISFLSNKIKNEKYNLFIEFINKNSEFEKYSLKLFHKFIMKPTNKKFMGFNFSTSSNEYSIYEYISKKNIVSVLESLQIDLIRADLFNEEYLLLSHKKQKQELEKLKQKILKHILEDKDSFMLYVFEELYLKGNNILKENNPNVERENIILTRNKIISKSRNLNSFLIKK